MEYCGLGSVNDALKAFKRGLTEAEIAYVLEDTLKGLRDLHRLGYIHRDIKSANILLNDKAQVKLGTFSFSLYQFECIIVTQIYLSIFNSFNIVYFIQIISLFLTDFLKTITFIQKKKKIKIFFPQKLFLIFKENLSASTFILTFIINQSINKRTNERINN